MFCILMIVLTVIGFILLLLALGCVLYIISQYNKLVHLRVTCEQTIQDIVLQLFEKASKKNLLTELLSSLHKTSRLEKQVDILNHIHDYIQDMPEKTAGHTFLITIEETFQSEKRFFNTTARELNERLCTFPGQQIGGLGNLHKIPLLTLNEHARAGSMPEAKYVL